MRAFRVVVLAALVTACGTPQVVEPSIATTVTSEPSPAATPEPSVDGHPLSELLPAAVTGVATKVTDLDPVNRSSPRIFLKVIARLAQTPDAGEVALAFTPDSTVYAVRVAGADGSDVLMAYLAERGYPADEAPPTESIGGKQATRLGSGQGNFLYWKDDVFYYLEGKSDQAAADMLQLLP